MPQSLSLKECITIPPKYAERANKVIWKIHELILPFTIPSQNPESEDDPKLV